MTRKLFVLSVVCLLTVSCTNMIHDMVESGKDRKPDQGNPLVPIYSPGIQALPSTTTYKIGDEIKDDDVKVYLRQTDGSWKPLEPTRDFTAKVEEADDGKTFSEARDYTVVVTVHDDVSPGNQFSATYYVYVEVLPPPDPDRVGLVVIPKKTAYNPGGDEIKPVDDLVVYTRNAYGVITEPLRYDDSTGYTVTAEGTSDGHTFLPETFGPKTVTVRKGDYTGTYSVWVKPVDGQAVYEPQILVIPRKVSFDTGDSITMTGSTPDLEVLKREPEGPWTTLDYTEGDYTITSPGKLNGLAFAPGVTGEVEITVASAISGYTAEAQYRVFVGVPPTSQGLKGLVVISKKTAYDPGGDEINPVDDLDVYTRSEYGVMTGPVTTGYTVTAEGTSDGHTFLPETAGTKTVRVNKAGYSEKTYLVWVKPADGQAVSGPELKVLPGRVGYTVGESITMTDSTQDLVVQKREPEGHWSTLNYGRGDYTITSPGKLNGLTFAPGVTGQVEITVTSAISDYPANAPYKVYVGVLPPENPGLVGLVIIPKKTVYEPGDMDIDPDDHLEVYTRDKYGLITGPVNYAGATTGYTISIAGNAADDLTFPSGASGTTKVVTVAMTGYTSKTYNVWVKPTVSPVVSITMTPSTDITTAAGTYEPFEVDVRVNSPTATGEVDWEIIGATDTPTTTKLVDVSTLRAVIMISPNEVGPLTVKAISRDDPSKYAEVTVMLTTILAPNNMDACIRLNSVYYIRSLAGFLSALENSAMQTMMRNGVPIEILRDIDVPAGGIDVIRSGSTVRLYTLDTPKTLRRTENGTAPFFTVEPGAKLILNLGNDTATIGGIPHTVGDVILDGGSGSGKTSTAPLVKVDGELVLETHGKLQNNGFGGVLVNGKFTMNGGEISGNTKPGDYTSSAPNGGGVQIRKGGIFTMNGGRIYDNQSFMGGGVGVDNGTFIMSDGDISENSSPNDGGGVSVDTSGRFFMMGGNISGNESTNRGGGVSSWGEVIMMGGNIFDNISTSGGGGVFNARTFTMMNGNIYNNTVNAQPIYGYVGGGGGVYNYTNGTFTMTAGNIYSNTVNDPGGGFSGGGGGVFMEDGTFTMMGGSIYHNTASDGGGVLVYLNSEYFDAFAKRGGIIYGSNAGDTEKNTASGSGNAVMVKQSGSSLAFRDNTTGTSERLYFDYDEVASTANYEDPEDDFDTTSNWAIP